METAFLIDPHDAAFSVSFRAQVTGPRREQGDSVEGRPPPWNGFLHGCW